MSRVMYGTSKNSLKALSWRRQGFEIPWDYCRNKLKSQATPVTPYVLNFGDIVNFGDSILNLDRETAVCVVCHGMAGLARRAVAD